jgi:TnpA family transposase
LVTWGATVPVEFLGDDEVADYGTYSNPLTRKQLETLFFLDDEDKTLVAKHRGDHMRMGFALQLVTVRYLGTFLNDPLDVPTDVLDYIGQQLEVSDPSCVKRYMERPPTRFGHAEEIRSVLGLTDFRDAEAELTAWIAARAWTTGDGPKAIFMDAVGWLRKRRVLLPGVTTLARLVARVRDEANQRLFDTLAGVPSPHQRSLLDGLLGVRDGARISDLERWRRAPTKASGPAMVKALDRVVEIGALGLGVVDLGAVVPHRRVVELARYGMAGSAQQLRRHPDSRKVATLLATVVHLKAIDDALELLDLLMVTELVGKAQREADKQKVRRHPRLARASAKLAVAIRILLDLPGAQVSLDDVWQAIDAVLPRSELREALATVNELAPPGDEGDREWRAALAGRIVTVSGFLKVLTNVIEFGSNADGAPVLAAMRDLPVLLKSRKKLTTDDIHADLVTGSWKGLVNPTGNTGIDKNAYVFCVLTEFHRRLKRRDVYAERSSRWRDPRAQLLSGEAWASVKDGLLTALGLPEDPDALLGDHARLLDEAYREVAGRLGDNAELTVDRDNRLHVAALDAIPEPASLVELDRRLQAMLPRVDLPEVILEVMRWEPGFLAAFTSISGGRARLTDLNVTIAACLSAHAMNVGFTPVITKDEPALERDRLFHVDHTYLCAENYAAANAHLVLRQAQIPFAQILGGGHVAAVDGMRFVVGVKSIYARPNRKYFGPRRGITWLNMLNDQAVGLGYKIVSGAPRDTLHVLDVAFNQDAGQRPDVLITDAGSYADLIFGLVNLLDMSYRPALADLPDQRAWRINAGADYGPLNVAARGRIDLEKIRRQWPDILRVVGSIYAGSIRAVDVVRMLQRDGHPTPLGEAIASYGRIFKSLHILAYIDDEAYRRAIKGMRNLQEGRHSVAEKIFHGRKGRLYRRYYEGMEDQLGALGLVLNCVVLWNTFYLNAALEKLRASGYDVREEDVARLSPFVFKHLNVHGHYFFLLPDMPGGLRELRDPEAPDEEGDEEE